MDNYFPNIYISFLPLVSGTLYRPQVDVVSLSWQKKRKSGYKFSRNLQGNKSGFSVACIWNYLLESKREQEEQYLACSIG